MFGQNWIRRACTLIRVTRVDSYKSYFQSQHCCWVDVMNVLILITMSIIFIQMYIHTQTNSLNSNKEMHDCSFSNLFFCWSFETNVIYSKEIGEFTLLIVTDFLTLCFKLFATARQSIFFGQKYLISLFSINKSVQIW